MSLLNWQLIFPGFVDFWIFGTLVPLGIELGTSSVRVADYASALHTLQPDFQKLSPVKPIYYRGGRPLGTKPVFCDFPSLGVRSAKTQNVKRLRTTIPDTVVTFFCAFGTPSGGKLWFSVFGPVPGFLQVPAGQNRPKYH